MEQAGIDKIQLIENRNITRRFDETGTTVFIESGGNIFDYDSSFPFTLDIQEAKNGNGKIGYNYNLGLTELEISTIQKIRRSIYGFLVVCFFSSGESKILAVPLNWDESPQSNNISASYSLIMSNFVNSTQTFLPYQEGGIPWILDTGFWDDEAYWIGYKLWID